MSILYTQDISQILPEQLQGFFQGWPNHPSPDRHLQILQQSYAVWLALDSSAMGQPCVGFINALSDGVFYAYIPLLEVLPAYQDQGLGQELVQRMLTSLEQMYAIDLVCDESVAPFYDRLDFGRCVGMVRRNYLRQSAKDI